MAKECEFILSIQQDDNGNDDLQGSHKDISEWYSSLELRLVEIEIEDNIGG